MLAPMRPQEVIGGAQQRREAPYSVGARLSMPTTNQPIMDPSTALPRIPKLTFRNRLSENGPPGSQGSDTSTLSGPSIANTETSMPSVSEQAGTPESIRRPSEAGRHSQRYSTASEYKNAAVRSPTEAPKKKKSSVLGFLTLKEPSTSAWEQFAEQEKKKAALKGGRANTVGLSGVSSQKLPAHVPAVNSKWDGMPESTTKKSKGKQSGETARSKRESTISTSTRRSQQSSQVSFGSNSSSKTKIGSLSSKISRPQSSNAALGSQSARHLSVQSTSTASTLPLNSRISSVSAPAALSPSPRETCSLPTSPGQLPPLPALPDSGFLFPFTVPDGSTPVLEDFDPISHSMTSPESSPATPAADAITISSEATYPYVRRDDEKRYTLWISDAEDVIIKSSGPDVLVPPMSLMNQKARRAFHGDTSELHLSDSSAAEDSPRSILKGRPRPAPIDSFVHPDTGRHLSVASHATVDTMATTAALTSPTFSVTSMESTRPSTAVSTTSTIRGEYESAKRNPSITSCAPSEMSAQWKMTPKERLGLGGKIKKAEVLPWEMHDPLETLPAVEPSKKKRFSMLSRK